MNNEQKQQIVTTLKEANNVLVTVQANPTVDELSAAIGVTLLLNKLNKHATTVFSGKVPSTLEFLQPDQAIEQNTDSLRDFIIALDKSKADKLRYKVEDSVVRIFITPYKTSISEKDLEFSQGDFNVDVVLALGVVNRDDFDLAVTTHGRILHDATVIGVTMRNTQSEIGAINWNEPQASSLSEMIATIALELGESVLDGQMATAFLTGIVAETDRFKNEFTTPMVLSLSSRLMTAGANQQLIAEKLEEPATVPVVEPEASAPKQESAEQDVESPRGDSIIGDDGSLEIIHDEVQDIHIDDEGNLKVKDGEDVESDDDYTQEDESGKSQPQDQSVPTTVDDQHLDASSQDNNPVFAPEGEQAASTPDVNVPVMAHHHSVIQPPAEEQHRFIEQPEQSVPNAQTAVVEPLLTPGNTLEDLEKSVGSPHVTPAEPQASNPAPAESSNVDDYLGTARDAVTQATVAAPPPFPSPTESVGAQMVDLGDKPAVQQPHQDAAAVPPISAAESAPKQTQPQQPPDASPPVQQQAPQVVNPSAAPAVPPPMMPQFFDADGNNQNPFLNPPKQ